MNGHSAFQSMRKVLHSLCFVTDIKILTPLSQPTKNIVETMRTFSNLAIGVHSLHGFTTLKIQAGGVHLAPDSKLIRNKG